MGLFDGLAGGLLSGIAGMFGQSQTNEMQLQMMQQQQAFQERMSSTAYQRASTDMQAAGLNPMMMFSSGSAASSPAGAAPSAAVKSGLDSDSISRAMSTATQMRVADATINNLVEQNAKIKAETLTESQRPLLVANEAGLKANQMGNVRADTANKGQVFLELRNRGVTAENERAINGDVRKVLDQTGYGGQKVSDIISPVTDVVSSAAGVKRVMPKRSTLSREHSDSRGTARTFEERWSNQ
jgi:hypothetical protein